MGERTLITFMDGVDKILVYSHFSDPETVKRLAQEVKRSNKNNMHKLAKFVVYYIVHTNEHDSCYIVPQGKTTYGEDQKIEINIGDL